MSQAIRAKRHRLPLAAYRGEKAVSFTVCIQNRKRPFVHAEIATAQLEVLLVASHKHSCKALIYCFMPDHLHVILRGMASPANPKTAMDSFKFESGLWFSRHAPSFEWQADYYDHIIRHSEDLRRQVCYIAENPVRAGLVEDIPSYPFSGAENGELAEMLLDLEFDRKFGFGK